MSDLVVTRNVVARFQRISQTYLRRRLRVRNV